MVQTVEVGRMTAGIPPSALVHDGTRTPGVSVIVLVAGTELSTSVRRQ